MDELIPGAVGVVTKLGIFGGGSLATLLMAKWLGRKKEDVEMALDWQKFYSKHIEDIKAIHKDEIAAINELHEAQLVEVGHTFKVEIAALVAKVDELILDKANSQKLLTQWEEEVDKYRRIVDQKIMIIANQEVELEELRGK